MGWRAGLLACVPCFVACVGRGPNIKGADSARDRGEWQEAFDRYGSVISSELDEEWDKDRAESHRADVWHELKNIERGKTDDALGELESGQMPDADRAQALRGFVEKARAANSSRATWDRVAALRARIAPGAWQRAGELASEGRHLDAEELGLTLTTLPGSGDDDANRLAALRAKASASYEALRKGRPARSATGMVYGALADHFAGRPVHAPPPNDADWSVAYDLQLEGPAECNEVLTWVRGHLPSEGVTRVRATLKLDRCSHEESTRTATLQGESGEDVVARVEHRRVEVTEPVCETHYEDTTKQMTSVVDTGAGTSATLKWTAKGQKAVTTCPITTYYKDIEKPIYELKKKNVPYEHTRRSIATRLTGSVQASLPDAGAVQKPVNFGIKREDEAYERSAVRWDAQFGKHINVTERSEFQPGDATSIFAEHEEGTAAVVRELGKSLTRSLGELVQTRAATVQGEDRADILLHAAMLGSKGAEAQLGSLALRVEMPPAVAQLALLGGQDPFTPASTPWARPSDSEVVDTPPPQRRTPGFEGYKAGFRYDFVGGVISTGPFASGRPTTPIPDHETAAMFGVHLEFPLLGFKTERGHGFTLVDAAGLDAALAYRASDDPPNNKDGYTVPVGYRIGASYTALLGVRVGPLGVLGGARIEADMARTGEVEIPGGFSLPLCGRIEYRYYNYLMPRVGACAYSLAGRDRMTGEVTIPFASSKDAWHLYGRYDRTVVGADLGTFGATGGYTDKQSDFTTIAIGLGGGL